MSAGFFSLGMILLMSEMELVQKVVLIHGLAREENQ